MYDTRKNENGHARLTEIQMKENKPGLTRFRSPSKSFDMDNQSVIASILSSESLMIREKENDGDLVYGLMKQGMIRSRTLYEEADDGAPGDKKEDDGEVNLITFKTFKKMVSGEIRCQSPNVTGIFQNGGLVNGDVKDEEEAPRWQLSAKQQEQFFKRLASENDGMDKRLEMIA